MPSTLSLEVVGGPVVEIPWKARMTAQDALEAAYNQINSLTTFAGEDVGAQHIPRKC